MPTPTYLTQHQHRFLEELLDWLRIPSVSADPKFQPDVLRAAEFLKSKLEAAGAQNVELCTTAGNPIVYGEYFVGEDGRPAFSQSWLQNVGMNNYERLFTNSNIASQFLGAFGWTLVFAAGSVLSTFILGFALALILNDERLKGRRLYRSVLLMPYAVPGFIALLVWSNFYNRDFGLINEMLNLDLNWLGDPTLAKVAERGLVTETQMLPLLGRSASNEVIEYVEVALS